MDLIAPFRLGLDAAGELYEVQGRAFDKKAYSRMKYGIRSAAQELGQVLAEEVRRRAPELFSGVRPPAFLTSYKAAQPPATVLARYCLDVINQARFAAHLPPGELVQIYRPTDYIQEYATLPAAERKKVVDDQGANTLRGRSLDSFVPVIFDDIYITGTIARLMHDAIGKPKHAVWAFLATCDDSLVQTPHAETKLNTSDIRVAADLLPYIQRDDFVCTRRFLKMLLNTPLAELQTLLPKLPASLREQLARSILDTGDNLDSHFPQTCRAILDAR